MKETSLSFGGAPQGPNKKQQPPQQKNNTPKQGGNRTLLLRCIAILVVFVCAAGFLGYKQGVLQVEEVSEWRAWANGQQLSSQEVAAERGTIYDSQMRTLAESAKVWTVEASPDVLAQSNISAKMGGGDPATVAARELAAALKIDEAELYEKLKDPEKKYARVKAKIEKPYADTVREIVSKYNIRGIYLVEDTKRYYPYEEMLSSVLGFVSSDGAGVEGLEYKYNEILSGTPGRRITPVNAAGGVMPADEDTVLYTPLNGNSVVLTANADIQQVLEDALNSAAEKYEANERAMGIVMDVNTGAILAMATSGSFNPNDPYYIMDDTLRDTIAAMPDGEEKSNAQLEARMRQWRNKSVADSYEPGSVFKIVTAAAALDSGAFTADSTFYCGGSIEVADYEINCFGGAHGQITLGQALVKSCNVSFIQMAQQMGLDTWYDYLNGFGLTEPTGVDMAGEPGEKSIQNLVYAKDNMGPTEFASNAFGQSNKYTELQMITAVAAAVNGGYLVQPHIVDKIIDENGNVVQQSGTTVKRQVISAETSAIMRSLLEDVVNDPGGLGSNAYVAGYHVGGKSGTTEKLDRLTEEGKVTEYIASFVGVAPANNPQIAVLIAIDEPQASNIQVYSGGRLAAPAVGSVIAETMNILGVAADYGADEVDRTVVSTPKVAEKDLDAAIVQLNKVGLSYKQMGNGGTVLSQFPEAGISVPLGGTVVLYTSGDIPLQTATVPHVTDLTAKRAIETLKGMGFNVLTTGAPEDGTSVSVESQDYAAGEELPLGSVITLQLVDTRAND